MDHHANAPSRRTVLKMIGGAAIGAMLKPLSALADDGRLKTYARLDEVLEQPVLKRELLPDPVMIESVELLRDTRNPCRGTGTRNRSRWKRL